MKPTILVTRPAGQTDALARLLRDRGLAVVQAPTVAIDTRSTASDLDTMLERLDEAAWLVLTSVNGAEALAARLTLSRRRLPKALRVAAVGPATADALRMAGIEVDHVPDAHLTVAIADGLNEVHGRRVVLARADAATPALREALTERGAIVEEVVAYRTVEGPATSRDRLAAALRDDLAGVAFTSGSTVRGLMRLTSQTDRRRARRIPAFCIGPVTAEAARRSGFHVAAVAAQHTAVGLADAIADRFARKP